jgi:hypothetical protein
MLSALHSGLAWALAPVCAITWLFRLLTLTRHIVRADVILQSRKTHGFGTTYLALEVLRRLHLNKKILYFAFHERNNHNRKLDLIFGESIRFFSIQRPELIIDDLFGRPIIMPPRWIHDRIAVALNRIWFSIFAMNDVVIYDDPLALYDGLYENPDLKAHLPSSVTEQDNWNIDGVISVFMEVFDAKPLRLTERLRRDIHAKIHARSVEASGPQRGFCGIWFKMDPPTEKVWKNGSPVDQYLKALERLVDAGFTILWHGDRPLPQAYAERFQGRVFDYRILGVNKDIFNLFVPTESEIFIGDSGPGLWMAGCNGAKTLGLNIYPIGCSIRVDWSYFKHIVDGNGNPVPYDEVFRICPPAYDSTPDGWQAVSMNDEEIRDAVDSFISDPTPDDEDPYGWVIDLLPDWASLKMTRKGRLSLAWLRRNGVTTNSTLN